MSELEYLKDRSEKYYNGLAQDQHGTARHDLCRAITEIERLTAEARNIFFAGCDYGSKYAGDQYLGTPERQRGFDQWKRDSDSQGIGK